MCLAEGITILGVYGRRQALDLFANSIELSRQAREMDVFIGQLDTITCSGKKMINFVIGSSETWLEYVTILIIFVNLERINPLKGLAYELTIDQVQLAVLQFDCLVVFLND